VACCVSFFSRKLFAAHCSSFEANKARKAQEKAARAEVEQGAAAAQAKATAVRRNVAQKAPVSEAPMSELQKKLLARQAQ
jgi:predicted 2-oxoglutarate/Fe(II)-dependent dioxygenase YbiX